MAHPAPVPLSGSEAAALSGTPRQQRQQAARLAARLPEIVLAAERVATTVAQGLHGRRCPGSGESFWHYRPYQAGDPPARIDWRYAARSDAIIIREQEWETAQTVWLWCDSSPSMAWSSQPGQYPDKSVRAGILTLALALLLLRGGERVGLLQPWGQPLTGASAFETLASRFLAPLPAPEIPLCPEPALPAAPEETGSRLCGSPPLRALPRYATVVLLGDWLDPPAALGQRMALWQKQQIRGCLVQIRDPAESELPYDGRVRFEGLEGEAALTLPQAAAVRAAYRQRLAAHDDRLASLCRTAGWGLIRHRTDHPPETTLLALHQALMTPAGIQPSARGGA